MSSVGRAGLPPHPPHRLHLPRRRRAARPDGQPGRAHVGPAQKARIRGGAARQDRAQRQIEATDREIDRLVYELYGLTDDEIAIVEG